MCSIKVKRIIQIQNNGDDTEYSNFWDRDYNKKDIMCCSMNPGAFRILLPDSMQNQITEMMTGKEVIISKGQYNGQIGYEFLLDKHTENPYYIHIGYKQMLSM